MLYIFFVFLNENKMMQTYLVHKQKACETYGNTHVRVLHK